MVLLVNEEKYNNLVFRMGALTSAMLLCYDGLPADVQRVLKEQGVISDEQTKRSDSCTVRPKSSNPN